MAQSYIVPFYKPTFLGEEMSEVQLSLGSGNIQTPNPGCVGFFKEYYPQAACFFTNSCSSSLEMAVRALGIGAGDEVIVPGFGYVAVANAVVNNGAMPIFADVELSNGNMDVASMEACITPRTKAIIAIHYAGNACDIDAIFKLCEKHKLFLIEDAAQGIGSKHEGKYLGSFGHLACLSFDYMKNISCGQGGLLIVNDRELDQQVQIVYDNGTNRMDFLAGKDSLFEWAGKGNNCQMNPLASHFLYPQLKKMDGINNARKKAWQLYKELLLPLAEKACFSLPDPHREHNGHIFYMVVSSEQERKCLREHLRTKGIYSEQHYSSFAKSSFARRMGIASAATPNAEKLSDTLLRLPLWHGISERDIHKVVTEIDGFYRQTANVHV